MKVFKDKLLNVLLFPVKLYEKLTDNKITLCLGILLIGAVDLFLPNAGEVYKQLFTGKPAADVNFNIFITALLILVFGVVDVVFVGVPLHDFFHFLKRKEKEAYEKGDSQVKELESKGSSIASRIKIMKVYILSHFLIIPVSTLAYYLFFRHLTENSSAWALNMYLGFFMVVFIWSAAIMTRGSNALFRFSPAFSRLTYIFAFAWGYIFNMVFDLQIMDWLLKLYR